MNLFKKSQLAVEALTHLSPRTRNRNGKRSQRRGFREQFWRLERIESIEHTASPILHKDATPRNAATSQASSLDKFIRHTRAIDQHREQRQAPSYDRRLSQPTVNSAPVVKGTHELPFAPNLYEETGSSAKVPRSMKQHSKTHVVCAQLRIEDGKVDVEHVKVPLAFAIKRNTKMNYSALRRPSIQSMEDLDVQIVHRRIMNSAA